MISAWSHKNVCLKSPNGLHTLLIEQLYEVAMGAPTSGTLILDGVTFGGGFGPSAVWSHDSKFVVMPKWEMPHQVLSLINVETRQIQLSPVLYSVLELKRLEKGVLTGVISPIHQTRGLRLNIVDIFDI